ncbi:MAG: peptide ABC transporter substrate-binding protein [Clostridia bacterium]|nr:peptide ABC transporter substrate-binding protein [Clostridia bacterium]
MKTTKILSLVLALMLAFGSIGAFAEATYERADDEDVYEEVLGDFEALMEAAEAAEDLDTRFILEAQAEAYLLGSATFIPTTTRGGVYNLRHGAFRSGPYANWGNDSDRYFSLVLVNELVTKEDYEATKEIWTKAVAGEGEYNAAEYLADKGYTKANDYKLTFATAPATLDWLSTSMQADTEVTVQTVDGLVQYSNLGVMEPKLATSWEVSEDGLTYTFHLRDDAKWYTSEGAEYAPVVAGDFVAGFHHMLDANGGLEWLVEGIVKGASEYLNGGAWEDVGYEAPDDTTLVITLEAPTSYFMTMLTYSCFLPICEDWYLSHGGVFGRDEYAEASTDTSAYTFGKNTDVSSQVYCGPFLLKKLVTDSEIVVEKNPAYYDADKVTLDSVRWIYDDGSNPVQLYNDVVAGVYTFNMTLREANGTLAMAKEDGNFDKCAVIADTQSTTFFGGLNVNRGTFELASGAMKSPKTEQQKIDTQTALMNINFRKAFLHAFDRGTYNAVANGEDLKYTSLRNMYTHPEFVQLAADAEDADGNKFPAGTMYGALVQFYLDQMDAHIKTEDGIDGWYDPDYARECLATAKEELGDSVSWPIQIDVEYLSTNANNTAQAQAVKQVIEDCLGAENVQINLIEATTTDDFYASGYRAANGEAGNFDFFYGSGWGPDYGDPNTYLNTMLGGGAGYMTKVLGLF